MRKWSRWVWFLLVGVLVMVFAWERLAPHEPSYQGTELTEYLRAGGLEGLNREGVEAVRQIGTNAIPTLLKLLQAKDSRLKLRFAELVEKQHLVKIEFRSANDDWQCAVNGLQALETNADFAVPAICDLYRKRLLTGDRNQFSWALAKLGPNAKAAVPDLIAALSHTNGQVRYDALYALGKIRMRPDLAVPALMNAAVRDSDSENRGMAINAVSVYGTNAWSAIPELVELATNRDVGIRGGALRALGTINGTPALVVPVLTNGLADPKAYVREKAAYALASYGSNAWPAIPMLVNLVDHGSNYSAVVALGEIGLEPDLVVPVLIDAFHNPDGRARELAAQALSHFGTNARPAVPAFLEVYAEEKKLRNQNEFYRRYGLGADRNIIIQALTKIDPDAAAKAKTN